MTDRPTYSELESHVAELTRIMDEQKLEISRLKHTNHRLQGQKQRYRKIIDTIQEGYFETDVGGNFIFCNQALCRILGYSRDELIGRNFVQLTPPKTARALRRMIGNLLKSRSLVLSSHFEVYHKEGHTLTTQVWARAMKDSLGVPTGFKGTARDVSEEITASERDKQLQNQLFQAQKMEALGTLAGGLAHGFNNVLMAIQGNLSLVRINLPEGHGMHKHLERISRSTDKGVNLAKQILSFAKLGKFVVMATDLNTILRSTSRMFMRSNPKLHFHELYEENLWETQVDRVQIGQTLLSLYVNAAEAMPEGGDVYLQSENMILDEAYTLPNKVEPGRFVKISVTDNGKGLSEDAKRRIFEPFFSAHTPARYEGLGLAAVYGTVKSHNGIINVYSEKGHGTTFTLYIPTSKKDKLRQSHPLDVPKGTETILLVDDDKLVAQSGRAILELAGYRVMVASSGLEAIDIYGEYGQEIDLILLDIIMPDLSGDQVFHELRKINPNILVVLVSGYSVNNLIDALLKQGCVDFIQKPFQTQSLSAKVRLALDHGRPEDGAVLFEG